MTKKHFIKIAAAFKASIAELDPGTNSDAVALVTVRCIADALCAIFKDANPDFDKQRFLTACGF